VSRLVYTRSAGAEQCPDEATLRRAVVERLGYDPFLPNADHTIVATIDLARDKLRGEARLLDDHGVVRGSREHWSRPAQCDELVRALALSISISIDPASLGRRVLSRPPSPPPVAKRASTKKASSNAPRTLVDAVLARAEIGANVGPAADPEEDDGDMGETMEPFQMTWPSDTDENRWGVGVDMRALFNVSPITTVGGAFSVTRRWHRWSGVIELGVEAPTLSEIQTGNGTVNLQTSHRWIAGGPCAHLEPTFVCGLITGGRFAAHRADRDVGGTETGMATGARFGLEVPLSAGFAFRLQSDVLATLVRRPVTLEGTEIWRAPALSMSVGAALRYRFP